MSTRIGSALLLAFALLLGACTSKPVLEVRQTDVPASLNQSQVEQAILTGLQQRRWSVIERKPGLISASIVQRQQHRAVIEIRYDARSYSISHRSSEGLDYRNGKIHRTYNNWVTYLDRSIQQALHARAPHEPLR